jgi:glucokinase
MKELVLAADIGGTNCRTAVFDGRELVRRRQVPTAGHSAASALVAATEGLSLRAACLAVAGPVDQGRARLTNHHWSFDERELSRALGCPVRLVNDFHAAARGVPELGPQGWRALNDVAIEPGPIAVLGPGTGLGQALLLPTPEGDWQALPGEGGHVDFAPNDAEQAALWAWLHERHNGHVSVERVLSGPGLLDLHRFHRARGLTGPQLELPEQVGRGSDEASRAAVRTFVRVLGARAGSVALQVLPAGGVWICGGITPRLPLEGLTLAWLQKGRFEELLRRIPLRLVTDPDLGLLGAAALARRLEAAHGRLHS